MTNDEIMLEFARSAIFGTMPNIPVYISIDWDELMDTSSEQGLLAWVWDGICKLPENYHLPRIQRINWSLSAQEIKERYLLQYSVLQKMIEKCRNNNMRLLLLKGIGLSELYPNPQSRPSGDIDVFFFDDYEKGNKLFCQGDFIFGGKHAEFSYEGVHVENHLALINTTTKQQIKVERFLESTLPKVSETEMGYYILSPIANLVYLLMHSLSHLDSIFVLPYRSIIDFGMFLNANRKELPPSNCYAIMKELGLSKSFELLLYLVEWILGINFSEFHLEFIPSKDIEKARKMLANRDSKPVFSTSAAYIKREYLILKHYYQMRWLLKYLPQTTAERLKSEMRQEASFLFRKTFSVPDRVLVADFIKPKRKKR